MSEVTTCFVFIVYREVLLNFVDVFRLYVTLNIHLQSCMFPILGFNFAVYFMVCFQLRRVQNIICLVIYEFMYLFTSL